MKLFLLGAVPLALAAAVLRIEAVRGLSRRRLIHGGVVFLLGFLAGFPLYLLQLIFEPGSGEVWSLGAMYRTYLFQDYLFFALGSGVLWILIYGRGRRRRFSSCSRLEAMAWLAGGLFFLSLGDFLLMTENVTAYEVLYTPFLRIALFAAGGTLLARVLESGWGRRFFLLAVFTVYTLLLPFIPVAGLWNRPEIAFLLFLTALVASAAVVRFSYHRSAV